MTARSQNEIVNPEALKAARDRGWPLTLACISDAAKLAGIPVWVAGTDAAMQAGLAVSDQARRDAVARERGLDRPARRAAAPTLPPLPASTSNPADPPKPAPPAGTPVSQMTDAEFAAAVKAGAWR